MSDIFQEVDEEVRRDRAAEFWKKYQNVILAGAALIVLASAGFRYWHYERERARQAAGDQFQQALAALEGGKLDEAKAGFDKIAAEAPSGYRALAQMAAAGAKAAERSAGRGGRLRRGRRRCGDRPAFARRRPPARGAAQGRHPRRRAKGRSGADFPFGRGKDLSGASPSSISRRWRWRAKTMTTPPSSSTSCSATPKFRRTSGNWRAAGLDSWPRTEPPRNNFRRRFRPAEPV